MMLSQNGATPQAQPMTAFGAAYHDITTFAALPADPRDLTGYLDGRDASDYTLRRLYDPTTDTAVFFVPLVRVASMARHALRDAPNVSGVAFSVTSQPLKRANRTLGRLIIRWQGGPSEEVVRALLEEFVGFTSDPSDSPTQQRQPRVAHPFPVGVYDRYGCTAVVCERRPAPTAKGNKVASAKLAKGDCPDESADSQ